MHKILLFQTWSERHTRLDDLKPHAKLKMKESELVWFGENMELNMNENKQFYRHAHGAIREHHLKNENIADLFTFFNDSEYFGV